jgi:DNA-binding MarR family transcriptional regulator
MPVRDTLSAPPPVDASPSAQDADSGVIRFLRCGHILGSLLREILDASYLGDRCQRSLTRTQFCLLKLSTINAELSLSEVARYLGVTPAAMTKNVDKLERMGLVSRTTCESDRRSIVLNASADGVAMVRDFEAFKESRIEPVIASLDEAELDQLCDLLEALCVDLVRHGHPATGRCLRCAGYYSPDCLVGLELGDCALRPHGEPADARSRGRTA